MLQGVLEEEVVVLPRRHVHDTADLTTAFIIDGMAIVQWRRKVGLPLFGELAKKYLEISHNCSTWEEWLQLRGRHI